MRAIFAECPKHCKTLGGKRTEEAFDRLSLVEEAAMRLFECASNWERSRRNVLGISTRPADGQVE